MTLIHSKCAIYIPLKAYLTICSLRSFVQRSFWGFSWHCWKLSGASALHVLLSANKLGKNDSSHIWSALGPTVLQPDRNKLSFDDFICFLFSVSRWVNSPYLLSFMWASSSDFADIIAVICCCGWRLCQKQAVGNETETVRLPSSSARWPAFDFHLALIRFCVSPLRLVDQPLLCSEMVGEKSGVRMGNLVVLYVWIRQCLTLTLDYELLGKEWKFKCRRRVGDRRSHLERLHSTLHLLSMHLGRAPCRNTCLIFW